MKSKQFALLASTWKACMVAGVLVSGVTAHAADLHFPQPAVDVGQVRCGAPLSQRFSFVNQGSAPVEIVEVRASCGCLTPRLAQRVYQPGETGSLLLEVNTLSEGEGPHTWTCQVTCHSVGRRFDVPLQISGRVIAEVTVRPAVLTVFTDSSAEHEIVLTDRRPRPLTIAEVASSSRRLTPRLIEQRQDSQGHWVRRIRLEVGADFPEGRHDEMLCIYTDDPLYRELRVPVTVVKRSRPRVTAVPAEVVLQSAGKQPIPTRLVRLRDSAGQNVVVERIVVDDSAIACQWAAGPDTEATLKIRVDRTRLSGSSLSSAVHVYLGQPVREIIIIPVRWVSKDQGQ